MTESDAIAEIVTELHLVQAKFPRFNSGHEAYAVILEELDELWEEIKARPKTVSFAARAEAIQVAAMALRFLVDLAPATENLL